MKPDGAVRVVEAVADRENVSPEDLPPLNNVIDPDCLDRLFRSIGGNVLDDKGLVEFPYCGYQVTYHAEGEVELE